MGGFCSHRRSCFRFLLSICVSLPKTLTQTVRFCSCTNLISCSCLNARRRRARGQTPIYGTHWMAPPPYRQGDYQPAPPPQYQRQDPNQGFYAPQQQPYSPHQGPTGPYGGQQESGIELQQPPSAYHGGEQLYAPPPGPPPGAKN